MNTSDMISPNESNDIICLRDLFQRRVDGYVNITKLAKQYHESTGKRRDVNHWLATKSTQEDIEHLSAVTGIPVTELVQVFQGGTPELQGTFVHPKLSIRFGIWLSSEFGYAVETWFQHWTLETCFGQTSQQMQSLQQQILDQQQQISELQTAFIKLQTAIAPGENLIARNKRDELAEIYAYERKHWHRYQN
ncbi:KilA-N domain-containing protein [Brasilonema sp. CT11]|nr:KilA-N domain-containing protein [Brasilonema sp. CT11]